MNNEIIRRAFETIEYGPAPESEGTVNAWLDSHKRKFGNYIDGAFRPSRDHLAADAPARAKELAKIAQASDADVDTAVKAAEKALGNWQALGGHGRARHLYSLARGLQKHAKFFSVLEAIDNGKPIRETRDIDIPLVSRHFYYHAGWASLLPKEFPDHEAIGVVGQIIPWNFPLLMLAWKIAPALCAGNTVVLKPAEFTSLTALRFAELCTEVGLPPGVVNIVTGDGRTGAALVAHPKVKKIAFTGSTDVGRIIREKTAGTGKKLSLELGGKSPFIVFGDADLDSVVEGVVDAIWFNQGQVCCAGSRILAEESIAARLLEKLRTRLDTLRVGDSLDKGVDIGAIVAPVQLERIKHLVHVGQQEGATLWQSANACPATGCFYPPTILSDVSPASTVAQEEIFGPVVVFMTFRTPDEAVALANNTRFGLAASVWSENIHQALYIAPAIKAGSVWVNCTNQFDAASGFGGYRESGFGREGGLEGVLEYLQPKTPPATKKSPPQKLDAKTLGKAAKLAKVRGTKNGHSSATSGNGHGGGVDRTAKLYIGGKQTRPDEGYSTPIAGAGGEVIAHISRANRKDARNAVEAAHKAQPGWAKSTPALRAQVLYYVAENLSARSREFAHRLIEMGATEASANGEVAQSIERLFTYAGWADKYDGLVHAPPQRNVVFAMNEPLGVIGIVCGETCPLLGFVSAFAAAISMGNAVVIVPSERAPLAATDFYQVLDTSDVPGGVVNILTGPTKELAPVLAGHDGVDAVWHFGAHALTAELERASAGNMKRTWMTQGSPRDFVSPLTGEGREFLREATQVKNVWVPYGI